MATHQVKTAYYSDVNKLPLITTPDGNGLITIVNGQLVYISKLEAWFDEVFLDKIYKNKNQGDIEGALHTLTPFKNLNGLYTMDQLLNAAKATWTDYKIMDGDDERITYEYELLCAFYAFSYLENSANEKVFEVVIDGGITKLKVVQETFNDTYSFNFPS